MALKRVVLDEVRCQLLLFPMREWRETMIISLLKPSDGSPGSLAHSTSRLSTLLPTTTTNYYYYYYY